jgi:PAS domain S-box-containing protein
MTHIPPEIPAGQPTLAALVEAIHALARSQDPDRARENLCDTARQLTGATRAQAILDGSGADRALASALAGLASRTPRRLSVKDPELASVAAAAGMASIRSMLIVPIAPGTHPLGWLILASSDETFAFNRDHERMAAALAAVAFRGSEHLLGLRELERALEASESGLARAQFMARLAHIVTDADGTFVSWSQSLPMLLGRDPSTIPGSTREWIQLIHPDDREAFRAEAIKTAKSGLRANFTYRLRRADGEWIHLTQWAEAMQALAEEMPLRWFSTIQDVTAVVRAQEEVRRLNDELEHRVAERTRAFEETNREIEALTYTVAHDLRAPLRAIEGFSAVLQEEHAAELSPEARGHFDRVRRNVKTMGRLIDDLLGFVRFARQPLVLAPISLGRVAQATLREFEREISTRKVEVRLGDLPECQADAALVAKVFHTLVENALKFTRNVEGPVIEIGARNEGGEAEIFVRDNGIGFDMAHATRLFGVFQKVHSAPEYEGSGVGLAIAHRIVGRHGGRIQAKSAPGEGTTIRFTLG